MPANVKKIGIFAFAANKLFSIKFLANDFEMPFEAIAQTDDNNFFIHKNFTVYGVKNTAAESAAKRLGCTFVTLDESERTDYSLIEGCTDVTAALYDVYSDFLTEYYIQKFPEAALEAFYCTDDEHVFFSKLSKEIIANNLDKSIPEALYDWMTKNIYAAPQFQYGYPIDVYKYKTADCMGNAYLLCELLRSVGVPAVVAFGWGGNMENYLSEYNVILRTFKDGSRSDADHAWVMYYYNSKWNCADSALKIFTSDREEISKHYYIFCADGLSVYSDYYSPIASALYRVIDNGKFFNTYAAIYDDSLGGQIFISDEGVKLYWDGDIGNEFGEEGWVTRSYFVQDSYIYKYIKKNGYFKTNVIQKVDNKTYWFSQNGDSFEITDLNKDFVFGLPVFKVGDQFKLKAYVTNESGEYNFTVQNYSFSGNREVVKVDQEGTVTVLDEGEAMILYDGLTFDLIAVNPEPYKAIGLKSESNSDKIKLSWNKMPNAKEYVIKQFVDGVWIDMVVTDANQTSFEIDNVNIEYTFAVDVIASMGENAEYRFENEERAVFEATTLLDVENGTDVAVKFAEGTIPENTELKVEKRQSDEYSNATIYEIELVSGGKPVQPTAKVSVRIPIPSGASGGDFRVYYRDENGKLTDMKAVVSGGYIVFTTDHFSEYILTTEQLIPDAVIGDVNNDQSVNDRDSIFLDRYLGDWDIDILMTAADLNGDGKVNDQDSIILARTLAGWYE